MGAFEGQPVGSSVNIYNSDGIITDAVRNVQIGTTLNFLHGAAGVNGKVNMTSGGYFKNSVATGVSINTFFEYNHNDGKFKTQSDIHTVTGFKATRIGTLGNPTADVELFAGSNGDCYMNLGATTPRYFTLVNGNISQCIYISSGAWSIGNGLPDHSVGLTVYGKGGTIATASQVWKNSIGTHLMTIDDGGRLKFGLFSEVFLEYSSGSGSFFIGNPIRTMNYYGPTHRFNGEVQVYNVRSTITPNTNYQMNQFGISFIADGSAGSDQTHFNFNVGSGPSTPGSAVVRVGVGASDFFLIYGDQRWKINGLPTYTDDAAAGVGGLTAGFVYKTATGELRIKL